MVNPSVTVRVRSGAGVQPGLIGLSLEFRFVSFSAAYLGPEPHPFAGATV